MEPEREPIIRVTLSLEFPLAELPDIIAALGEKAVGQFTGQQRLEFIEQIETEQLKQRVSLQSVRNYYNLYFNAPRPSSLAVAVAHNIGTQVEEDEKETDAKGHLIAVQRAAWDREVTKVLNGTSTLKFKSNSQKLKFLREFQTYLLIHS